MKVHVMLTVRDLMFLLRDQPSEAPVHVRVETNDARGAFSGPALRVSGAYVNLSDLAHPKGTRIVVICGEED